MGGQNIPWGMAVAVFLGTLPLLGSVLWNLVKVERIDHRMDNGFTRIDNGFADIRKELLEIRKELSKLTERLATLEERDRWTHPITRP